MSDKLSWMGKKAKHTLDGFIGVIDAVSYYRNGVARILMKPITLSSDGKVQEGDWVDAQDVELI